MLLSPFVVGQSCFVIGTFLDIYTYVMEDGLIRELLYYMFLEKNFLVTVFHDARFLQLEPRTGHEKMKILFKMNERTKIKTQLQFHAAFP